MNHVSPIKGRLDNIEIQSHLGTRLMANSQNTRTTISCIKKNSQVGWPFECFIIQVGYVDLHVQLVNRTALGFNVILEVKEHCTIQKEYF